MPGTLQTYNIQISYVIIVTNEIKFIIFKRDELYHISMSRGRQYLNLRSANLTVAILLISGFWWSRSLL